MVARHARQSIFDRPIRPARVTDDGRRSLDDAAALGVEQEVALEPVWQVEYELAAVGPECSRGVAGADRMGEQVLPARVRGEIVALPVDDAAGFVALDKAVVLGNPGAVEAGPD